MGVSGNFWDLLKPYARLQGFDSLRNKRVAIDLSYWIVQHETAIKSNVLNPHLRLTFFRTINLFSRVCFPSFFFFGTVFLILWFLYFNGVFEKWVFLLGLVLCEFFVLIVLCAHFEKIDVVSLQV